MDTNTYLHNTMMSLSNIIYNCSQNPDTYKLNLALDSIKSICKDYENVTGRDLKITDLRKIGEAK